MPALRQLFTALNQCDRLTCHSTKLITRCKKVIQRRFPQRKDSTNHLGSSGLSTEGAGKQVNADDSESGGRMIRQGSMIPRVAGLGSAMDQTQAERLDYDLVHHEDERLSPRESPWVTPRVSPRLFQSVDFRTESSSTPVIGPPVVSEHRRHSSTH